MKGLAASVASAVLVWLATEPAASSALAPYQLVRSLQLVQDRIAAGDHAALPMQRKLLEMIDARLRRAIAPDFEDRRNFEAMLVYGMSGGNPVTLDAVLSRLAPEDGDRSLARGIRSYLRGDLGSAMVILDKIDPRTLSPELGSFVALVKGSVIAGEDPKTALQMFDWARLLGPGTLVEEAALRRSLPASARIGDSAHFLATASTYVRRFLRSPYATQFADELVGGIVQLAKVLDVEAIEASVAEMTPEHQRVIYLRLARTAAIEGLTALSDFASRKSAEFDALPGGETDVRARLYANLSTITSTNADQALGKLRSINRTELSAQDGKLLDAALSVAQGIIKPPTGTAADEAPATVEPSQPVAAPDQLSAVAKSPEVSVPTPEAHAPADASRAPVESSEAPAAGDALPVAVEARRKLAEIDKLLAEKK